MAARPDAPIEIAALTALGPGEVERVHALVASATRVDGAQPLNDHVMFGLRYGGTGEVRHLVARSGAEWVGYGHLDLSDRIQGASAQVVVSPGHRRRGIGAALVARMLEEAAPSALRLWAHGHHPASTALAARLGFTRARELWQLRRSLHSALPLAATPAGVTIRPFEVGADEDAWLKVNAEAFIDHPEQGAMTRADLERREQAAWFEPRGFFLAERDGELLGFHWTKVHSGGEHDPIGEVYVLGVAPAAQGLGLGKVLTLTGLRHLRDRGLDQVMLYVESDNAAAITVYQRLEFVHWDTDVMYCR